MANRKISDLTALTAPVTGDLLPIVDISEAAAADKNKKITYGTFLSSVPLGTAAAPSIAFTGDINTGIYSPGADTLAFVEGGTEAVRIDSSSRPLVGTSTARSNVNLQAGDRTPHVQIETSTNSYNNGISIINNSADGYAPQLTLGLSLANGIGSNGNVSPVNPAAIGMINFVGNDGDQFLTGARIEAVADAVTGNGDMPGRLVFSTTADGAANPTERMRINNAGTINFANVATYADNAAATSGGLAVGDVYRTSTGQLMIRY